MCGWGVHVYVCAFHVCVGVHVCGCLHILAYVMGKHVCMSFVYVIVRVL